MRNPCPSVESWNESCSNFLEDLTTYSVLSLSSTNPQNQYNRQWVFRNLALAVNRTHNVKSLYYATDTLITDLPGPDNGQKLKSLAKAVGGAKTVSALYVKYK